MPAPFSHPARRGQARQAQGQADRFQFLETILIWLLFAGLAGLAVPHVNETHYLAKAKHFWNPDWCANDLFLDSAYSHWLFYFGFGWLTLFLTLDTFAWVGRIATWLFLAWAWRRLSWQVVPRAGFATLSAGLFFLLNSRFHLAGEWVVGGFEAKGIAYGFLIWALAEAHAGRWNRTWPLIGLAASMHVLVGGWAAIALGWVWLIERRAMLQVVQAGQPVTGSQFLKSVVAGLMELRGPLTLAALLFVAGAVPALISEWGTSSEIRSAANRVYVNERLAHHLNFSGFPVSQVAKFAALVVFWFVLYRWCWRSFGRFQQAFTSLLSFGLASLLIAFGGLMLSGLATESGESGDWAIHLLKLYWFRLADFAVPATLSLMVVWLIAQWLVQPRERARRVLAGVAVVLIVSAVVIQILESHRDPRPVADQRSLPRFEGQPAREQALFRRWRQVCQWIRFNTPPTATFLTPSQQQTFKWYAHRAEVVCWKDIPQDAASIMQWVERVEELVLPQQQYELGLMRYSDDQLRELGRKYGAQYLLVPQWQANAASSTELKCVYPATKDTNSAFVVFEL